MQFIDKNNHKLIILEVVVNHNLWIWHAFFGLLGNNNDMNMLDRSPLISNLLRGANINLVFEINGKKYLHYYLLVSGTYPC
jgi:hypothetical protein